MSQNIKLNISKLKELRTIDSRLVSYNIEMTEITGGTFWKSYTKEQIAGTEEFPPIKDFSELDNLMQLYEPADLSNELLRKYAKGLGSVYIRVSGSWATDTYYDFDGHTGGVVPAGYQSILTEKQWKGLLDFVKAVDAKLMVSVANCEGAHNPDGTWNSEQTKLLFDYSKAYGVPIDAAEFMNEPNAIALAHTPKGYTPADFGRDQDLFFSFIRENYPEVKLVGPCATGDYVRKGGSKFKDHMVSTEELLSHCKEDADIFSYHYYAGLSERGAIMGGHWNVEEATTEPYLDVAYNVCKHYVPMRDKYCPGSQMWVTESGDAGCGGNTWASTYLEIIRYADELARFCTLTDGIIFHNTLSSSDYGLLDRFTHQPRPNYWLAYIWNQLIGSTVYDSGETIKEGAHVYAHSRKDGKKGYVYVLINNSTTDSTLVEVPCESECYTLSAETLRSQKILLNNNEIALTEEGTFPELKGISLAAGTIELKPATVTFLIV